LRQFFNGASRFAFQWMDDIVNDQGERVVLNPELKANPRVEIITRYFAEGEYAQRLAETRVMLLPYRRSSYGLRVSRVVIEALVNGIPVVATQGTTLMSQAEEYGAAVGCEDGSVDSLRAAMETMENKYSELHARALERMPGAGEHFSVKTFRRLLEAARNSAGPTKSK
jgi:glycosyltransferase involved in cell wall biosynthesis